MRLTSLDQAYIRQSRAYTYRVGWYKERLLSVHRDRSDSAPILWCEWRRLAHRFALVLYLCHSHQLMPKSCDSLSPGFAWLTTSFGELSVDRHVRHSNHCGCSNPVTKYYPQNGSKSGIFLVCENTTEYSIDSVCQVLHKVGNLSPAN